MNALTVMAEDVAQLLRQRGETIVVAETSTGGLISSALLALPGASAYYKGGSVLYT
ncbi:MAG TPA: damage-inducible protein, partial [Gammaproteobacteria bacterium]|nr:damage-inducible protein [Gammaproteobacteria bacterium]